MNALFSSEIKRLRFLLFFISRILALSAWKTLNFDVTACAKACNYTMPFVKSACKSQSGLKINCNPYYNKIQIRSPVV